MVAPLCIVPPRGSNLTSAESPSILWVWCTFIVHSRVDLHALADADWWMRIGGCGLVDADWWMRIGGCGLVDADWWMRIGGCGLVDADWWMRIGGCGLVDADWWMRIGGGCGLADAACLCWQRLAKPVNWVQHLC